MQKGSIEKTESMQIETALWASSYVQCLIVMLSKRAEKE